MSQNDLYSEVTACRLCQGVELQEVLNLGEQVLASSFPHSKTEPVPAGPLELVRCANCGLVQLRHSMQPDAMYTHDYGYRSGLNATMRNHLASITAWVESKLTLNAGDTVLDIGCNDGTLLSSYRTAGLRLLGIDPIAGKFADTYPETISAHPGYFTAESYRRLMSGKQKAKVITSIAMFYDLERPNDFVADIAQVLDPEGLWVLEQSYLPSMLEANSFDTICHEHLEYYCLGQIEWMARQNGLRVFDVSLNDANGGSFRLAVCHREAAFQDNLAALAPLREAEARQFKDNATFADFGARIRSLKDATRNCLQELKAQGKSIHLYGASTKGNTLLQYYGIDGSLIDCAAERNPEKLGRFTPKTFIPIVSEEESRRRRPDAYLVLPWHFRNEFIAREADYLAQGGKMIFPLPELKVVSG
jgi:cyclopropane fatty-acyl-phospholipid synthase-like methyltransferase